MVVRFSFSVHTFGERFTVVVTGWSSLIRRKNNGELRRRTGYKTIASKSILTHVESLCAVNRYPCKDNRYA